MSAIISPCGRYRFRLERDHLQVRGAVCALIGVNPSTADSNVDDATIRKDVGFARRNGWRKIIKGNIHPLRATDVRELGTHVLPDDVWAENMGHLAQIVRDADLIVPCWGALHKLPPRFRQAPEALLQWLWATGKPVYHLGLTKCGQPRHPLMLGYDTLLTPYPRLT